MTRARTAMITAAAALAFGAPAVSAFADETVIIPGRVVQPDGTLASDVAVIVEGGRIKRLAPASEFAQRVGVVRHPDAVLSPGLIAVNSSLGLRGLAAERSVAVDPTLAALDGVDHARAELARAMRAGITAVQVMPAPGNVVSGGGTTFRAPLVNGAPDVLREFGPFSIVLASSAFNLQREPTSRAGALQLLRETLSEAKAEQDNPLKPLVTGKMGALVTCETPADVASALILLGQYEIAPVIAYDDDVREIVGDVRDSGAAIVLGPLEYSNDDSRTRGAGLLAKSGVAVTFSGARASEDPDSMRTAAALAVRGGMEPAAARRALTVNAAAVAGVADRIGALRAGLDADFVLFSADPLRPDARVLEVWIRGERVFAPPPQTSHEEQVIGATDE